MCDITSDDIKEYINYLQQKDHGNKPGFKLSSYTIKGEVITIKIFFKYFYCEGYITQNIAERIIAPKVKKKIIETLNKDQIEKLLSIPNQKKFVGFRNYLVMLLFLDSGIRLSELINIRIGDISIENFSIKITGKGAKERIVPFGAKVARTLIKYLKWRNGSKEDFLFVNKFLLKIKKRRVEEIIKNYGIKANISGVRVSPHTFRHTFALSWIRQGGDTFSLQRILGHSSLEMVKNYVNLSSVDVLTKHKKYGFIDNLEV